MRTRKTRGQSGKTHVIPYRAVGDSATRTLLAAMQQDRPTVRSLAASQHRAVAAIHRHLAQLRAIGAITWTSGARGTLRAHVHRTSVRLSTQRD